MESFLHCIPEIWAHSSYFTIIIKDFNFFVQPSLLYMFLVGNLKFILHKLILLHCFYGFYDLNSLFFKFKYLYLNHNPCLICRQRNMQWLFRHGFCEADSAFYFIFLSYHAYHNLISQFSRQSCQISYSPYF